MVRVDWLTNRTNEGSAGQHVRPIAHLRGERERACIVPSLVYTEVDFTDRRSGHPCLAASLRRRACFRVTYWWPDTFIGVRVLAIDPAVPISCMFIGALVANSASYGTVRVPFDQCCGLSVTLKIFV